MANITEVVKIGHYWAEQTTAAISWRGGLTFLVALCALAFNVWAHFVEHADEEKRRKGADALDRARRRRNDAEDEARRRRNNEEDDNRKKKKEEEEVKRKEAVKQLKKIIEEYRYVRLHGPPYLTLHCAC